ncbi:cytochrome P450 [Streptomyces sp. NRRL S-237]|uniref:cytochrome P450 n=1 Tax=Streptomyces sp. NRRL S-237 TaxID=1463895 RepID=UPI0004C57341|nr:cytochrome P450 [Streptomyces sp. NRRL S-237]
MDTVTALPATPHAPRGIIRRILSRQGREDPFPLFEEIRAAGPVVGLGPHSVLVTGYKECTEILTDRIWQVPDQQWRTERGMHTEGATSFATATLPRLNPPRHGLLRQLMAGPFTPRALVGMRPAVRRLVRIHLDALETELERHGRADFVSTVARTLPVAVMGTILGLPAADLGLVSRFSAETAALVEPFATPAQITTADAAAEEFHTYLIDLLDAKAQAGGDDLLSQWLGHEHVESGRVSMGELVANVGFLVGAGVDTTASLFVTALQALEGHPEQATWVSARPDAWPQAIEELMRWDPSVQNVLRVPARDTVLAGIPVPAGTLAHVLVAAANRDPQHFPDPHALDFRRPPQRSIAFGAGIHYCVGAPLARLTALEFLPELLRRFPTLRTDGPATRPPGISLRTVDSLIVTRTAPRQTPRPRTPRERGRCRGPEAG